MCQILKKILSLFVLFSLSLSVWASEFQNVNPELFLENPQEMQQSFKNAYNNSNQNSEFALIDSKLLTQNSNQQEIESMSAWELLNNLEESYNNAEKHLEAAILSSKNLESELLATKIELQNCKELLQSCKEALLSNKDDTHVVIEELGKLQEKITKLDTEVLTMTNKRNAWRTTAIVATPIALGIGFVLGFFVSYKYAK